MTLEAWVNPSNVSNGWRDVIYKGNDNYFLEATSGNNAPAGGATLVRGADLIIWDGPLTANTWTYLAFTYDGAMLRLYVNGAQVSSQASGGPITTSTNPLQIGGDSIFGQYFCGNDRRSSCIQPGADVKSQIQADMATAGRRGRFATVGQPQQQRILTSAVYRRE